jgi:hypothetical protein
MAGKGIACESMEWIYLPQNSANTVNGHLGTVKGTEFLDQLNEYQLLKVTVPRTSLANKELIGR